MNISHGLHRQILPFSKHLNKSKKPFPLNSSASTHQNQLPYRVCKVNAEMVTVPRMYVKYIEFLIEIGLMKKQISSYTLQTLNILTNFNLE
jgi:hypothetical protein